MITLRNNKAELLSAYQTEHNKNIQMLQQFKVLVVVLVGVVCLSVL